jgi:hypothetical protein
LVATFNVGRVAADATPRLRSKTGTTTNIRLSVMA